MRKTLLVLVLALVTAGVASAAPVYWSPAQMRTVAPQLPGPLITIDGSTRLTRLASVPSCVGIGRPSRGAFPGYRCAVEWKYAFTERGRGTLWVRPQAGSFCVSSFGFAACPAVPRPDDPRVCGTRPADRYAENCTSRAARTAVDRAVREAGRIAVNLACVPRSTLVVVCDWGGGTAVVTFTLGASWRTGIVLSPRTS
jgi:hypothetical protein